MDVLPLNGRKILRPSLSDAFEAALQHIMAGLRRHDSPRRGSRLQVTVLEELLAEPVSADRRKDEFLAMVSHELRSPLASMHHAVRFLSSQPQETPARQRM